MTIPKHYSKFHLHLWDLYPSEIQQVALPEIAHPVMECISELNLVGRITGNSMSRHEIYFPVKSSQYHYWKFHVQPWDLLPSKIQPVALLEFPHPAIGFIFQ